MFIDRARIYLKAGDGGDGVVRFRREKYIPAGGPAGGDGGRGGSIYFVVDEGLSTLMDFRYRRKFVAPSGQHGQSKNMAGKDGEDLEIRVPPGTVVIDDETGEVLLDLTLPGSRVLVLPGGRGGRGNTHFTTPTRQAPAFAERGEPGRELWVKLELKLLADVGLVGYPNVGKSTLLSVVSAARPKIANYHFTTLRPNLGVVSLEEGHSFVIADIPGLIEGAHEGVGLGMEFLRHIERTRLILHLVDAAGVDGRDPLDDYYRINEELRLYSAELAQRPQILVANKADLPEAQANLARLEELAAKEGHEFFVISAATNQGTTALMRRVGQIVQELKKADPPVEPVEQLVLPKEKPEPVEDFTVVQVDDEYVVEGAGLERLMRRLDLNNEEAIRYLQNLFEKIGLYKTLAEMRVPEGATVRVGELEFEYME
ncbi:MAG TPA: GTPase ObgE [Firmicutes bacterium]|jgi:GTP-binding protein|nr:GTPase ObgE [Bacillota bacterium]